jgi:hypothetical protein
MLIILAWGLVPALGLAEQCPGTNEIVDPAPFKWTFVQDPDPDDPNTRDHWVGTMEIAEATLSVGSETITTRVYRQEGRCNSIPGPTITMAPGNDRCALTGPDSKLV